MSLHSILFYLIGGFALLNALLAVSSRKIFRSAIFLLFSLMGVAGIYFWMEYEFIAAVQIIVYVGGIVVLILFSIFLTQQSGTILPSPALARKLLAALLAVAGFLFTLVLVFQAGLVSPETPAASVYVTEIGRQMLDADEFGYALPFEVVSLLLLAAMIGCIVIALRQTGLPVPAGEQPVTTKPETVIHPQTSVNRGTGTPV